MSRLRLLLLLILTGPVFAAPTREWFALTLGEHRIGYIERSREVASDIVETREYFRARLNRNGVPLTVTTEERHRERRDGTPLRFHFRQTIGESELRVSGELIDGRQLRLWVRNGRSVSRRQIAWPEGALLMEGIRLREQALLVTPGLRLRYRMFNPASLEGVDTEARLIGPETLQVSDRLVDALRIEHVLALAQNSMRVVAHIDHEGRLLRTTLPLFGRELVISRDSERVVAPQWPRADIYDFTLVAAPASFRDAWRAQALRYRVAFARHDDGAGLPGDEQRWQALGDGRFEVVVDPDAATIVSSAPSAAHLASTTWINADDSGIRRLAERAIASITAPADRMARLEQATRARIDQHSMRVGYASAREAFDRRDGDCTEHALLLAALARSIGIPARIVIGLVYAEQFGRHDRVFAPHAWVQAFVDGHWRSYDAAQAGFGSDHIALAIGDGDPSDYYASLERIGVMRIESVERLRP